MNKKNCPNYKKVKPFIRAAVILLMVNTTLFPCTFFMSTVNGKTFFGNNEDSSFTETNVWFIPAKEGKHGYICFGYDNGWPQGGMNDQGLSFDGASTPRERLRFSPEKKDHNGNLIDKIMEECSTVDEVIKIVKTYKFFGLHYQGQLMFADKKGNAVIVGGPDKNSDIDIIRKKGNFMVCTNFFPNYPERGGYPCKRYKTATRMLKNNPVPSVRNFRSILKAVSESSTNYSNIFDTTSNEIYIYNNHNFSKVIKIKLEDELKKGPHAYKIRHLFTASKSLNDDLDEINKKRELGRISRRIPVFIEFKTQ